MKNKLINNIGTVSHIFIGIMVFIAATVVILKYGIQSAFIKFDEPFGVWERIINIGIYWMIGMYCLEKIFPDKNEIKEGKNGRS